MARLSKPLRHLPARTHPSSVLVRQPRLRSATSKCLLVGVSLLLPAGAVAQGTGFTQPLPQVQTGTSAPPLSSASGQQNPFLGGVPSGPPTAGVLKLSMLEAIQKLEQMTGKKLSWKYVEENRKGDHICYISDTTKFKSHYPHWKITIGLDEIFRQIIADHTQRLRSAYARER